MRPAALILLISLFTLATQAHGQLNIIHDFSVESGRPGGTGIDNGVVYGYSDFPPATDTQPSGPYFYAFSFNLDGSDFRSVPRSVNSPVLGDGGRPVSIADGQFWTFAIDTGVTRIETATLQDDRIIPNINEGIHPVAVGDRIYGGRIDFGPPTSFGLWSSEFDGSDFQVLKETNAPVYPVEPYQGKLYAASGINRDPVTGDRIPGEIFSISPDGSDYTPIASVDTTLLSLALTDEGIFGLGFDGLFRVDFSGENFEIIDESLSGWRIVADDNFIYGVDNQRSDDDSIFRYAQDGTSDLEVIHEFGEGPLNGLRPNYDLTVIGSNLYGSAEGGGGNDAGIFYSIATDSPAIGVVDPVDPIDPSGPGSAVPEPTSVVVWGMLLFVGLVATWKSRRFTRR